MKAKKSLGQNFLINDTIKENIVSLLNVKENDLIIEIGPGMGAITQYLVKKNCKVICIEIDTDMKNYLSKYENDKCKVIYEDILNCNLHKLLENEEYDNLYIVGNLPYYITSPILTYITESNINPSQMVFMVQKEVADRYSAKKNNSNYGYMSVYLDYYYDVNTKIFVGKENFNPVPKVDSAVICLTKKERNIDIDTIKFFNFLKTCFQFKRKTLKNNLKGFNLNNVNIDNNIRAENLSCEEFIELYNKIFL